MEFRTFSKIFNFLKQHHNLDHKKVRYGHVNRFALSSTVQFSLNSENYNV